MEKQNRTHAEASNNYAAFIFLTSMTEHLLLFFNTKFNTCFPVEYLMYLFNKYRLHPRKEILNGLILFISSLAVPTLYYILLFTTEGVYIPKYMTYYTYYDDEAYRYRADPKCNFVIAKYWNGQNKNLGSIKIANAVYEDAKGNQFTSLYGLIYGANGNNLTLVTKNLMPIKRDLFLLDVTKFKRFWLADGLKYGWCVDQLPDYILIPLSEIHQIKELVDKVPSVKLKKDELSGTYKQIPTDRMHSLRTLCSSSNLARALIGEARKHNFPTHLAGVLQNKYCLKETKQPIDLTFDESMFCFVFAIFVPYVQKNYPRLVSYLKDYEKKAGKFLEESATYKA